ncbi:2-amino-4-hydroxy-6-hydroxymethyldihydropteridine diphosphokinase [Pedobacter fastidiosus]|uniref:2-amino-4-hydroxy-6-hydroxymethyldihydropteridine pyrophosphokinase n=1 Tax=Pedobacter fastidiosus TaxID=2765361 RepID=A0ABR7KRU9_9SPHI|nr:2-amino-4-hydroxy-6-hydroxymethyldihydropteridine diphosphokinase [Pedobacter fastidiosus]MBC6110823.1 2-amino-4-hydroxy-6-hydroxymethyldihydropteridine diphosphokinase [Pedobacter fastidiosus]
MALERTIAYLLLGSNLGNRAEILDQAIQLVGKNIGNVSEKSSLYETDAWGKTDQPVFLNQAIAVNTTLTAVEVLDRALEIEQKLGRIRKEKWGERLIDIDLILYGNEVINIEDKLQVPHPQMQFRKFVMEPLNEIASEVVHPILNITISEITKNITDNLEVKKL